MKVIVALLSLSFLVSNSGFAESIGAKVDSILNKNSGYTEENYTAAGYHFCSLILEKREALNEKIIDKTFSPIIEKMNKELRDSLDAWDSKTLSNVILETDINVDLNIKTPSKDLVDKNYRLGAEYHEPSPSSSGSSCFAGDTNVLVLAEFDDWLWDEYDLITEDSHWSKKDEKNLRLITKNIKDLTKGEFVLSSTLAMTAERAFIKDCWTPVKEIIIHEPNYDSPPTIMTLELTSVAGGTYDIRTTPGHNFYAKVHKLDREPLIYAENWSWVKASKLNDAYLYSGNRDLDVMFNEHHVTWINKTRNKIFLYNISVPTHTYYVGISEEDRILAHNLAK